MSALGTSEHEAARVLHAFGAASAALESHRATLPAALLELAGAVHTLANVAAIRLEGRDPGAFNLDCEQDAWDTVLKAWSARPGQDADSLKFRE